MSSSFNRALGNLAMWFDIIPTFDRPKLAEVEAGTAEFDYMLATILFDLVKKNALLHKALREFALHADPELTARYLADVQEYSAYEQDYASLAPLVEQKMLDAISEGLEDHMTLAKMVARFDGESA
jgi:hypothetical protein